MPAAPTPDNAPCAPEFDAYGAAYTELLRDPLREKFAPGSQFFFERKLILLQDFYRRHAEQTTSKKWVDIGCGQGDLLKLGRSYFHEAWGCDPSAGMLAGCGDLNVRRQVDPDRVPFSDASFDLATAVCVYHHVDPPARVPLTREILRVLQPDGILCIIEHNPLNPATRWIVHRTPVDAQARLLTAGRARHILRAAGAAVLETRYFLYFPERLYPRFAGFEESLAGLPCGGQYAVLARKLRDEVRWGAPKHP